MLVEVFNFLYMSIFDKIKSFEIDKNSRKIFGIKSAIVWGYSKERYSLFPLLYLRKPKNISEEEYQELINSINISFKKP